MKISLSLLVTGLALTTAVQAQRIQPANTIAIDPGNSKAVIIDKAAHVVPTANQLAALRNEFIAFVHFGPNTFTRHEWGNGMENPNVFALNELHTDQWCQAMKAAGMKMVILTAKHHDGFVLWQSRYTTHGIMSSPFQQGRGDVVKDLSASCKKYGLKLGIYLSPADLFQIESPTGLYGNLSKQTRRTIPRNVPGRPFRNQTKFEFEVDDYNEYFLNQLFELLTEYGPIDEVWFDGAHPKRKGNQQYAYLSWKKLIHVLAPKAVVFGKEDVRWCGNEAGQTRDTEWNIIPYAENPGQMNSFQDLTDASLGSREDLYKGKFLHYQQAETNTSIREGWFYRDDTQQKVRNADDVFDIYERSVGGNSTFLLNIPPNREGKFSPEDVGVLTEAGRRITETYGRNLFSKATAPRAVLDSKEDTYLLLDQPQQAIILSTPTPVTINRLVLQEAIATHSERVEKHALDAWLNNEWREIATATNIGYKRILRFPDVTASKFRVRVLAARLSPAIATISAHFYPATPPSLQLTRNAQGQVTIEPRQQNFNWNTYGGNAAQNLSRGATIVYTTDGSAPTATSRPYAGSFPLPKGEVKAMALLNGKTGPVASQTFGLTKQDWMLLTADSELSKHAPKLAFDADPRTYWSSGEGEAAHFIALDLGQPRTLTAFTYTPQTQTPQGMLAKGKFQTSQDGKTWQDVDSFAFGNLVNDPTPRQHMLKAPVSTRYVRLLATDLEGNSKSLAVAELDFFE